MIRWRALLVEDMRSVTRSMDFMIYGPGRNRISCCGQNDDGIAFFSWYVRQADTNVKQDCSWFGQ